MDTDGQGWHTRDAHITVPLSLAHIHTPPPWGPARTCRLIKEVGQETAHHGLVTDDQHILLPLQLHDDRLEALDQVLVGLQGQAGRVPQALLQR